MRWLLVAALFLVSCTPVINSSKDCAKLSEGKGDCYTVYAVLEDNPALCEKVKQESMEWKDCYTYSALAKKDSSLCKNENCRSLVAMKTKDKGICQGNLDCERVVESASLSYKDPERCALEPDVYSQDWCYLDLKSQFGIDVDCGLIKNATARNACLALSTDDPFAACAGDDILCWRAAAKKTGDYSRCPDIPDPIMDSASIRDECINAVAKKTKNFALCKEFKDKEWTTGCELMVAMKTGECAKLKGNSGLMVKGIEDSKACFAMRAFAMRDKSICEKEWDDPLCYYSYAVAAKDISYCSGLEISMRAECIRGALASDPWSDDKGLDVFG